MNSVTDLVSVGGVFKKLNPYALYFKIALVAAVLLATFSAGWKLRDYSADADIADLKSSHSEVVKKSLQEERERFNRVLDEERSLRAAIKEKSDEETARIERERIAMADVVGERDKLRDAYQRYARSRTCAASPAAGSASQPGPGGAGVVPYAGDERDRLQQEAEEHLRELAPALGSCYSRAVKLYEFYNAARARIDRYGKAGRTIEGGQ